MTREAGVDLSICLTVVLFSGNFLVDFFIIEGFVEDLTLKVGLTVVFISGIFVGDVIILEESVVEDLFFCDDRTDVIISGNSVGDVEEEAVTVGIIKGRSETFTVYSVLVSLGDVETVTMGASVDPEIFSTDEVVCGISVGTGLGGSVVMIGSSEMFPVAGFEEDESKNLIMGNFTETSSDISVETIDSDSEVPSLSFLLAESSFSVFIVF